MSSKATPKFHASEAASAARSTLGYAVYNTPKGLLRNTLTCKLQIDNELVLRLQQLLHVAEQHADGALVKQLAHQRPHWRDVPADATLRVSALCC